MALQANISEGGIGISTPAAETLFLNGTVDPSVAPGVVAPISSQFNRDEGADASIYQKFGPADTDWENITAAIAAGGNIGAAEDGTYTDGLFTDFNSNTPTGTAVDRFNEVLKALAPVPAPSLTEISCSDTGETVKLSFGASNAIAGYTDVGTATGNSALDINGTFDGTGSKQGAFSGTTVINGVLNDQVVADANGSFPANSFTLSSGTVELELNGVVIATATAVGGDDSAISGTSANGSNITIASATPNQFANGDLFDSFKYRTGTWSVATADQNNGWNYMKVIVTEGSAVSTNYFDWVNDSDATAAAAVSSLLDTLVMTGAKQLSGVTYNTAGTAAYDVTLSGVHNNVYSGSSSAVSFTETNCIVPNEALGPITTENDNHVINNTVATVTNTGRLLDAPITVSTNCVLAVQADASGLGSQTINGILLDNVNTSNSDVNENFCLEDYRLQDIAYATQASIASGVWSSANLISTAGPAGHANSLAFYNGAVRSALQGLDLGDFRNVADGNANGPENGPASNPNYSTEAGVKTFYRKFVNNSGLTKANFKLRFTGTGSFVAVATGASAQNLTFEMKFPDGAITTGTGWTDAYNDFATAAWADGDGSRNATAGSGRAMGVDWGITVGTKSIAAGESVIVKISADSAWTGNISDVLLTWL